MAKAPKTQPAKIESATGKNDYEATCDFPCYDLNLKTGDTIKLTKAQAKNYKANFQLKLA